MQAKLDNALASADRVKYWRTDDGGLHVRAYWPHERCGHHMTQRGQELFKTEDELVAHIVARILAVRQRLLDRRNAKDKK